MSYIHEKTILNIFKHKMKLFKELISLWTWKKILHFEKEWMFCCKKWWNVIYFSDAYNLPVLKHGSRSLIWMRMWNEMKSNTCNERKNLFMNHQVSWWGSEIVLFRKSNKVDMLGPERWWTILELVEVEGNSDGRP